MTQFVITVKGVVQGVCFRAFVKEKAEELGLKGYAKNLADGSVEILAQGEENQIKKLVESCKQGPPSADVQEINFQWEQPNKKYEDFITL